MRCTHCGEEITPCDCFADYGDGAVLCLPCDSQLDTHPDHANDGAGLFLLAGLRDWVRQLQSACPN